MTTPWPADVLDCAKRLAKSLGYEDNQIMVVEGRVEVYRQEDGADPGDDDLFWWWHALDPRNPTVWSALIGPHGVKILRFKPTGYTASCNFGVVETSTNLGIAVCEAYNALKSNGRGK